MNIQVKEVLEKRTPKKKKKEDGSNVYPIKLRLTSGKTQRYYSLPHSKTDNVTFQATEAEWDKIHSNQKVRGTLKDIKLKIPVIIKDAEDTIKGMGEFSFDGFRKAFYKEDIKGKTLFDYFEQYIEDLKKAGRFSTAQSYRCALNSFRKFDSKMDFHKVDRAYLDAYEKWFLEKPKTKKGKGTTSITTVGIYTRSLRAIFNMAIKDGITGKYPFGKTGFTPPGGMNVKKALDLDDIKKIIQFETENKSPMDQARDLWVFSYFCQGINFFDICSLQRKNIIGDLSTIEFVRSKTRLTRKSSQRKIEIVILPETKAIIEKWGKLEEDPESYVFPFFEKGFTPEQKRKTVMQLIKTTNKYLGRLSQQLELPVKITTYSARHSFASILKESGAPVEYISEALGHSNQQTTESYLKSFSQAHKMKWAAALRGEQSQAIGEQAIKED
jgi:integrase